MILKVSPLERYRPVVTLILLSSTSRPGPPDTRCGVNMDLLGVRCVLIHLPLLPVSVHESTHLSSAFFAFDSCEAPPFPGIVLGPPVTSGSKTPTPEEAFTRTLIWPPIFSPSSAPTEEWACTEIFFDRTWSFCATSARPSA